MNTQLFRALTPDVLMDTLEQFNYRQTGEYVQLNSYENRVFEIALEPGSPMAPKLIVKVYRPGRWSRDQILEEHQWTQELKDHGIHTVPPVAFAHGSTVGVTEQLLFAIFPKAQGRMLAEARLQELERLGRLLGQMHNVGAQKPATYRLSLNTQQFGYDNLDVLVDWVAPEVWRRYEEATCALLEALDEQWDPSRFIRIHGDFHRGNILVHDTGLQSVPELMIVDFDDFVMGPEVQDFWMLLSGDRDTADQEVAALERGYSEFRRFPAEQLSLIPLLRGLRIVHYAGWIARRWQDPVFPQLFPQFRDYTYWAEETEALEKLAWS